MAATLTNNSTLSGLSDGNSSTNIFNESEDSHPERKRDIEHSEANGIHQNQGLDVRQVTSLTLYFEFGLCLITS